MRYMKADLKPPLSWVDDEDWEVHMVIEAQKPHVRYALKVQAAIEFMKEATEYFSIPYYEYCFGHRWVLCPKHGERLVMDTRVSGGPDPSEVEIGSCGCFIIGFSATETYIV